MHLIPTAALFIALVFSGSVMAEPLDFKQDVPKARLIELKPEKGLGEMVGRVEGVVDQAGKRFYLSKLNVMSPLVIQVLAKDENKPLNVSLHRFFWTEKDREGTTNAEGIWGFSGRVHDEVGIELRAEDPSGYYILAWQGAAVPQAFGVGAFIPMESAQSSRSWTTYLLIAVLVLLTIAVAYLLLKTGRNKSAAGLILITALVPFQSPAADTDFSARLAGIESRLFDLNVDHTTMLADIQGQIAILDGQVGNLQFDTLELRNEVAVNHERLNTTDDKVAAIYEQLDDLSRQFEELDTTTNNRIDSVQAELRSRNRTLNGLISNAVARITALETLHTADHAAEPDPGHGDIPPMETSCTSRECWSCFSEAGTKLSVRLRQFERLRILFDVPTNIFDQAIGYGDATSGYHQLEQARWYEIKQGMILQKASITRAYTLKHAEFGLDLQEILFMFDDCESSFGLTENWFNRHGHLFYESFMAAYLRP